MDFYHQAIDLASNPKHTRWLSPLLLLTDAVFCALIIWKIPCELWSPSFRANQKRSCLAQPMESGADALIDTEIDWRAYVQQVEQYRNGERDYTLIKGDTGWTAKCALLSLFLDAKSGCQVLWFTLQLIYSYITLSTFSRTKEPIFSSLNVYLPLCILAP